MITLSEFQQLDLRVAEVVSAARIAGTDRLLQIEVDLGSEQRTLVASVARQFAPRSSSVRGSSWRQTWSPPRFTA